ncbi:MAG: HEAT repeat domain-containing protein [Nitrospirae bacterium]|nr:HEAT repeat domain-containing protein [Candidatus Manganitrophaceae bacterium]
MDNPVDTRMADEEIDDEGALDKEELKSVKEIIQSLTKTSKTVQIYLPNNQIHQKFISELFDRLSQHLSTFGMLRLRIKQFELLWAGQPVYENANRLESLAFKLFIDGLRELSFHPGIEKEEVILFLEVIGNRGGEETKDDDVVTLLWERHLVHIKYLVVDDLQGDFQAEECKEMQTVAPSPDRLKEVFIQEAAPVSPRMVLSAPKGVEIPSLHIFRLTEEEIRKIKGEVQEEEDLDVVAELEGILFDILRIERDPVLFAEILGIIDQIFEGLLIKGDFRHAQTILEFFEEMRDPSKGLSPVLIEQIEKAKIEAVSSKKVMTLEGMLDECEPERLEAFYSFLLLFDPQAVPPLVELLGTLNKMKPRRVLCEALIKIGAGQVDFLISKLEDDRWYLVRNLIYILGKIGDRRVLKSFPRLIHHKDAKIRKELLHVLETIEDPKTTDLLLKMVADPELSNRLFAVRALAKRKARPALEPLIGMLSSKEFEVKELQEKKEIFDAVARIGGDEVVPRVQRFLKTGWSLFKNAHVEEMGLCAASALQRIGTPPAVEALREGSVSKSKVIRDACIKSLGLLGDGKR